MDSLVVTLTAAALTGLCANPERAGEPSEYAKDAIDIAKATAKRLKTSCTETNTGKN